MAGLSDFGTTKQTEATTLPSWYSTAQQNVVNQALGTTAPTQEQTVAPGALGSAFGPGGSFGQATQTLQQIASGAANPWLVSSTGQVTPNVATPLGGLFQAQTEYANKMMPDVEAAATAPYISGGGFGSRMNIGAAERAKGQFLSDLFQKQMTSALQSQQTGATAGLSAAEATNKAVQDAITAATFQQNAPFSAPTNLAAIIGKLGQQPTSKATTVTPSTLAQLGALGSLATGGINALSDSVQFDKYGNKVVVPGILSKLGVSGGLPGVAKGAWNWASNILTGPNSTSGVSEIPNTAQPGDEAYGWTFYNNGSAVDPNGNFYQDGQLVSSGWQADPSTGLFVQQEDLQQVAPSDEGENLIQFD